jgi:hypothetical protein
MEKQKVLLSLVMLVGFRGGDRNTPGKLALFFLWGALPERHSELIDILTAAFPDRFVYLLTGFLDHLLQLCHIDLDVQ